MKSSASVSKLPNRLAGHPSPYALPISILPGIGPKTSALFETQNIVTLKDLLNHLPRKVSYQKSLSSIGDIVPNECSVLCAQFLRFQFTGPPRRKRLIVTLKDESGFVNLVFFKPSPHLLIFRLKPLDIVTVVGEGQPFAGSFQLIHPQVFLGDKRKQFEGYVATYPSFSGASSLQLSKHANSALQKILEHPDLDPLPLSFCEQHNLTPLQQSHRALHKELNALWPDPNSIRRLAFEELLTFQLEVQKQRHQRKGQLAPSITCPWPLDKYYDALLPFTPTGAQLRALGQIKSDLAKPTPMARLLQGDVGAGKTAVAAAAALVSHKAGFQSALMAPTEILANQHYTNFRSYFEPLGIKVALIASSLRVKARRELCADLLDGNIHILIGTHALISDDILFKNLGFCIIDEQHRFGVSQRKLLKAKAPEGFTPHTLVMTATPIPRSLALTLYGDLSFSVLDEMPKGRKPVSTMVRLGNPKSLIPELLKSLASKNEKSYIVYPLIEESESLDLADARSGFEQIQKLVGKTQVGLVHGRMKAAEKEAAIQNFKSGITPFLVSTTVVEVGMDVADATNMIIMHAERFGLSQLHQLRGRVGRGGLHGNCYLLADYAQSENTAKRLSIMEETSDGFRIAKEDLDIRGPGEFLGTKQSGMLGFRFFDFKDHADLADTARKMARDILDKNCDAHDKLLVHFSRTRAETDIS